MAKQTAPAPQDKTQSGSKPVSRRAAGAAGGGRLARLGGASGGAGSRDLGSFYRESVAELRKVTWPSWQDASNLTAAVIGMTVALALFLGLIDEILNYVVKPLIGQ